MSFFKKRKYPNIIEVDWTNEPLIKHPSSCKYAWQDLHTFDVFHSQTIETKAEAVVDQISYEAVIAAASIKGLSGTNPSLELLKRHLKINGNKPEGLLEKLIQVLQQAQYPYLFKRNVKGAITEIQNLERIKKMWGSEVAEIKKLVESDEITELINKMAEPMASADTFFQKIQEDFFLQAFFMPVYGPDDREVVNEPITISGNHKIVDSYNTAGKKTIKNIEDGCLEIICTAKLPLQEPIQKERIEVELKKYYNHHYLKLQQATLMLESTHILQPAEKKILTIEASIEITAGEQYANRQNIEVYFKDTIPWLPDDNNQYSYKTLKAKEYLSFEY